MGLSLTSQINRLRTRLPSSFHKVPRHPGIQRTPMLEFEVALVRWGRLERWDVILEKRAKTGLEVRKFSRKMHKPCYAGPGDRRKAIAVTGTLEIAGSTLTKYHWLAADKEVKCQRHVLTRWCPVVFGGRVVKSHLEQIAELAARALHAQRAEGYVGVRDWEEERWRGGRVWKLVLERARTMQRDGFRHSRHMPTSEGLWGAKWDGRVYVMFD
ncbi:hypothetical protein EDB19DRAFT_2029141 [Suillus lakei]|nr:hypothetical protein EDB19DRAFT_2029141 [Suillus lakei]